MIRFSTFTHICAHFFFLLSLLALPARAEEAGTGPNLLDQILARGTLRVGTTGDYRPFSYQDPATGEFFGLDIDMARALAAALDVRLDLVKTSWPKLMPDLLAGRFEIAMGGVSISLERQRQALFSRSYLSDGKTPIARCPDQERFATVADIDRPGVRVIVNPGGTNERFVRAHLSLAQIAIWGDNATIFDEIVAGRADIMITDASEALLQQGLHPTLCAIHPDRPFTRAEKAYLLPRDLVFKAFVDQWLHQQMVSGDYRRIAQKWLNPRALEAPQQGGREP